MSDTSLIRAVISADRDRLSERKLCTMTSSAWRDMVYYGTMRDTKIYATGNELIRAMDELASRRIFYKGPNSFPMLSNENDYSIDFVDHHVCIGEALAAMDKKFLKKNKFTHVLNVAEGIGPYLVNTNRLFYRDLDIRYLGIPAHDRYSYPLSAFFKQAADFINDAVEKRGRILVHCKMGLSRSAAVYLAYLIMYKDQSAEQALRSTFRYRFICPNEGFLCQLAQLENKIKSARKY